MYFIFSQSLPNDVRKFELTVRMTSKDVDGENVIKINKLYCVTPTYSVVTRL